MEHSDLPTRISDIEDVPVWARGGYKQSGNIWMMTQETKNYLTLCREELETRESEYATELAELREAHQRDREALHSRVTRGAVRKALTDAGCEYRLTKA